MLLPSLYGFNVFLARGLLLVWLLAVSFPCVCWLLALDRGCAGTGPCSSQEGRGKRLAPGCGTLGGGHECSQEVRVGASACLRDPLQQQCGSHPPLGLVLLGPGCLRAPAEADAPQGACPSPPLPPAAVPCLSGGPGLPRAPPIVGQSTHPLPPQRVRAQSGGSQEALAFSVLVSANHLLCSPPQRPLCPN